MQRWSNMVGRMIRMEKGCDKVRRMFKLKRGMIRRVGMIR